MSAMKSQEDSSSASSCSYHVFLSFRGEDTRKTFTDHFYTALNQAGFRTFRDDDGIEKGEDIKSELEKGTSEIEGLKLNIHALKEDMYAITFQISHRPTTTSLETLSLFKVESVGNVEAKIVNNLGLSNLQSMGNLTVKLTSWHGMRQRRLPLQGPSIVPHIIPAYIPSSEVPSWFNFKNLGASVDFIVPSYLNSRTRGLNLCSVYECSRDPKDYEPHTIVSNRTKGLVWNHCPHVFGNAEDGEDTMWLSYWKFGNHLKSGDEINISVSGGEFVQVKEVGVRLLYKEEQEEMSSQSAYEDEIPHQSGNIVPGNVSAHQPGTKFYQLGLHLVKCERCEHRYRIHLGSLPLPIMILLWDVHVSLLQQIGTHFLFLKILVVDLLSCYNLYQRD
ncbi:hypothetical protein RHMOL_Rhmol05G0257000 [Rhododendron molle]|uniref:Uncharacterized protein n=1 Tax=Rhododendron molle TaxID=49168 RepID=A0ACC0NT65_RHOML|nr:hypothetical protein RHMOL_Rhmol05G0257000 [Rhododendron molle]